MTTIATDTDRVDKLQLIFNSDFLHHFRGKISASHNIVKRFNNSNITATQIWHGMRTKNGHKTERTASLCGQCIHHDACTLPRVLTDQSQTKMSVVGYIYIHTDVT